jgi:hypothetical protein
MEMEMEHGRKGEETNFEMETPQRVLEMQHKNEQQWESKLNKLVNK